MRLTSIFVDISFSAYFKVPIVLFGILAPTFQPSTTLLLTYLIIIDFLAIQQLPLGSLGVAVFSSIYLLRVLKRVLLIEYKILWAGSFLLALTVVGIFSKTLSFPILINLLGCFGLLLRSD
ncbi:MAG: hypothetical protein NZT61_06540 [Deltaproteobacteria bacterium]|nr:hypothetical protein [Deltaproteobacteria bacterium]